MLNTEDWRRKCRAQREKSFDERFDEKIDKSSDSGCWIWKGCVDKDGYGFFRHLGKNKKAHRIAYERVHGVALGRHQLVCHSCDTPRCVNPAHLWVGSNAENQIDSILKGRRPHQKLGVEEVRQIRELYFGGMSSRAIASKFGVDRRHVLHIQSGRKWAHVD